MTDTRVVPPPHGMTPTELCWFDVYRSWWPAHHSYDAARWATQAAHKVDPLTDKPVQ